MTLQRGVDTQRMAMWIIMLGNMRIVRTEDS
jgi:hypothetical protein